MTLRLLAKHHLEFLSLKGGCTDSSETTLVKMPHRWKPHVTSHMLTGNASNESAIEVKSKKLLYPYNRPKANRPKANSNNNR